MKLRKMITSAVSVLLVVAAFYFLWDIYHVTISLAYRLEYNTRYYLVSVALALLLSLIGFLSMRNWFEYFIVGNIKINLAPLITGAVLLVIGAIPPYAWIIALGLGGNFIMILVMPTTHYVISVVAGIVIGRAFSNKSKSMICERP